MQPVARIWRGTPRNLSRLARLLSAGEPVAVPTETVYGLAADALSARACRKIFKAKGRPASDPLIVHIARLEDLSLVAEPGPAALMLAKRFWPGPLTLVLPKKSAVPDVVTAGLPSVAVRMPAHPLFRKLIALSGRPLAAPSANPFGYVSPTTAEHVRRSLGRRIGHILDGGPSAIGLESTILDLRDPRHPRLLRPGAIGRAALGQALGAKVRDPARRPRKESAQLAPGMLARHYSPRTPVALHKRFDRKRVTPDGPEAWLFFNRPRGPKGPAIFWLTERGNARDAAKRLFALLRRLDTAGFRRIHAELAPGGEWAEAINDRLHRAAGQNRAVG